MRESLFLIGCVVVGCGGKTDGSDGGTTGDSGSMQVFTKCNADSDCIIVPRSCCGSCGAATKSDQTAVSKSEASNYRGSVCQSTACPACAMMQDPNLKARCTSGMCESAP